MFPRRSSERCRGLKRGTDVYVEELNQDAIKHYSKTHLGFAGETCEVKIRRVQKRGHDLVMFADVARQCGGRLLQEYGGNNSVYHSSK